MTAVLIMAGGRSLRMRTTGGAPHKALVPVLGVPLLERNLAWLLAGGFTDLHIAVAADEAQLLDAVRHRAQALAAAFGARLTLLVETTALDTLGACGLCPTEGDLLVVNVDNLTGLDLNALIAVHRLRAAALTIASHAEVFRMPFGQLVLEAEDLGSPNSGSARVTGLLEKPEAVYQVSSGTYVLDTRARRAILPGHRCNPAQLFQALSAQDLPTVAMRHAALWIDVNDVTALVRAEALVAQHPKLMNRQWSRPHMHRIVLATTSAPSLWISRAGLPMPGPMDIMAWPGAEPIASFDEPLLSGHVLRCYLHRCTDVVGATADGFVPLDSDAALHGSRVEERCRAHLRFQAAPIGAT